MAKPVYKLSTVLHGHSSDVRAVATFADGTVVSASRDKTARVWKPAGNGKDYVDAVTLKGHTNFVSSVCVINPSERNPKGFILTGSNDNTICVYLADQVEAVKTIKAHQDTVCRLRTGKNEGTFLSSSWDMTAKLWDTSDLSKPRLTLLGNTAAVWCVEDLLNGYIVTGSADKLVIVWTADGTVKHKLTGHTDCVRDITVIKADEFLTCANDATVMHWIASLGTCLGSYCGHENYIYSVVATENGSSVFTCGEDRTIRVWYNGEIGQTINLPCQSIWSIDLSPNGDIIAGCSDGVVRIFSANPDRYADVQALQQFEEEVASTIRSAQLELGGIKVKDLPDGKTLEQPGQRDGQTKIVNEGEAVRAYSWSQNEQRWIKIGDVMGASGGSAATSGKVLYNGVEYDYVFSVDIQDGIPPLKLPYNNGQDPWHAAQKFLHDNGLSQLFLDQVANFIVKNSEPTPILNANPRYADPFTGGNRYIPDSGTADQEPVKTATPSESSASLPPSYIPHTKYLKLEQANMPAILDKLRDFNSKRTEVERIADERLKSIVKLASEQINDETRSAAIATLRVLLDWPNEIVFPVLDVARLAVLRKEVNEQLCTDELLHVIRRHIKPDASPSNQMLTFRLLSNMFCHEMGENLCLNCRDEVLTAVLGLSSFGNKHNQIAVSTYILNLIVTLNKHSDKSGKTQCLNVIFSVLPRLNESEAVFRTLVGLGTLLSATTNSEDRSELIQAVQQSETALNVIKSMSESALSSTSKLANCSKQIIDLIL